MAITATTTLALSACGAEEASVVKTAFEKEISSAHVTVAFSATAPGSETSVTLAGPYQSNGKGDLPSFDWKLHLAGAAPRPIEAQILSTGDDAFVVYGGETYQVGRDKLAQLQLAGGGGFSSADMTKMMGRMQDWFPQSDAHSDAVLNHEPVTRITGRLDLSEALKDMKEMAREPGASSFEGLKQLSGADLREVEKMVSDPRFTVDVAQSDGKLRRIAARMTVDNGTEKSTIAFSLQLKDVDKPVRITAPSSGRPIEELIQRLSQDFGGGVPGETTIS